MKKGKFSSRKMTMFTLVTFNFECACLFLWIFQKFNLQYLRTIIIMCVWASRDKLKSVSITIFILMKIKNNFPHICALPSLSLFRIDKMLQNNIAGMPEFPIMWGSRLTTNSNNRQLSAALRGGSEQQTTTVLQKIVDKEKKFLRLSRCFCCVLCFRWNCSSRSGWRIVPRTFSLGFIVSWCNNRLFSF